MALTATALSASSVVALPASAAVGDTITGSIWQDYDANGVFDTYEQGIAGIEVYAYDSDGSTAGPVTTDEDGTYSIQTTSDAEQWRVEANVPDSDEWEAWRDGANGADHRSTVQFVTSVPADSVDFAFQVPGTYVENNPFVYTPVYQYGPIDGPDGGEDGGLIVAYEAESSCDNCEVPSSAILPFSEVGATNGTAWQRPTETDGVGTIFAAAYYRRHAGFGPGGMGAIYAITPDGADWPTSTTSSADLFVDLADPQYGIDLGDVSDPGAGDTPNGERPITTADNPSYDWMRDAQAWSRVGRTGLGSMAFSPDERSLFVVNLHSKSLIRVDVDRPVEGVNAVTEIPLADQFPGDLRPYGLSSDPLTNRMYLTVTDTAESTQQVGDLHGYVYSFDPESPADLTLELDFPLGLDRGSFTTNFYPWSTNPADYDPALGGGFIYRNQPVLADAKVLHGNLIVGVRDLTGDLIGSGGAYRSGVPSDAVTTLGNRSSGAVLIATPDPDGSGFVLESNGAIVDEDGQSQDGAGALPDDAGPGGAAYFDTSWLTATPEALGSIVVQPSREDNILSTGVHVAQGAFQVGMRRMYQATGAHYDPRGAMVMQNPAPTAGSPGITAKGNGLGSMSTLASAAPIEIGNYVWLDIDKDGVQDPDEPPVAGATVNLYAADEDGDRTGDPIATVVTDADGQYYFTSTEHGVRAATRYVIGVDNPADFADGGVLENWVPTTPDTGDEASIDPDRNDSDGIVDESNSRPYISVTTGDLGDNDHTFDFGFWYWAPVFDKELVSTTENPEDDGTWEVVYRLTVTNEGPSSGEYDLSDDLTQMGEGIVLEGASASGPEGVDLPEGVELNEGFDAADDQLVIADVPIDGAGMTFDEESGEWEMGESVTHEYLVNATVSLETDDAGLVVPSVEDLTCQPADGGGSTPGSGAYNAATLSPDGMDDLVDDACPSLPYVDIDKALDGAPTHVEGEPGIWEVRYLLTVSNPSEVDTDYDLTDAFRFGEGMTIVEGSATVASTEPGTIEVSPTWNGVSDTVVVTDEPIIAGAEHVYSVTVRFALDLAAVPAGPVTSDCELGAGEDGTGLRNDAGVSFNGYENVDDACAETGEPQIDKTVVSAEPIGEGRWEVVYGVEVSNLGAGETEYDLDDELRFDETVTVESTEVTGAPADVTLFEPAWNGADQQRVAEDVALLGNDDDGYAAHEYELTVVAEVPIDLVAQGGVASCAEGAGSDEPRALNNVAGIDLVDERSKSDVACPPLPSFELTKTATTAPVAGADGSFTIGYDVVMSNTGAAAGEYDLFDQLDYPEGVDVTEVAVSETVPAGLDVVDGFTGQGEEEQAEENLLADDAELAAGASHTYRLTVTFEVDETVVDPAALDCEVTPGAGGPNGLLNGAVADHNDLELDAEVCTPLVLRGDPTLDKKVLLPGETLDDAGEVTDTLYDSNGDPQPRLVSVGDVIQYGITVKGHDAYPSVDVRVDDVLPEGVAYAGDYEASQGSYDGAVWTIGELAAEQVVTLVIDVEVEAFEAGKIITNVAQLHANDREVADDGDRDGRNTDPTDGFDAVDITVVPDPTLDKKVLLPGETLDDAGEVTDTLYDANGDPRPRVVEVGDVIQYGITVEGHEDFPAEDVRVDDVLPEGVDYAGEYEASQGDYDGSVWTIGSLEPGQVVTLVIDVEVEDLDAGTVVTNVAQLHANGHQVADDGERNGRNTDATDGWDAVDITVAEEPGQVGGGDAGDGGAGAGGGSGSLPDTGAPAVMVPLLAGLALLLSGAGVLVARRRGLLKP